MLPVIIIIISPQITAENPGGPQTQGRIDIKAQFMAVDSLLNLYVEKGSTDYSMQIKLPISLYPQILYVLIC